jgi:hypothetical protein
VRGRPNPLQAGGRDGGRKLIALKQLARRATGSRCCPRSSSGGWPPAARRGRARAARRRFRTSPSPGTTACRSTRSRPASCP